MKLAKVYKHYSLIVLLIVLLLGTLSHLFIFRLVIHYTADHTLEEFRNNIQAYVNEHDTLVIIDNPHLTNSIITVNETIPEQLIAERFCDTLLYNNYKQEMVVYRMYSFPIASKNNYYNIILFESTLDTEELIIASIFSLLSLFFFFILISIIVNRWFIRVLWHPFYQLLTQMEQIDLTSVKKITTDTDIDEFEALGKVVNKMLYRIQQDYRAMKEFTENTAHELQTPLAVAKAKIEILRDERLHPKQRQEVLSTINGAIQRVIRLNRSILLIAKIQNNQYQTTQRMDIGLVLKEHIKQYQDLIELKNIKIAIETSEPFFVNIHQFLAEMLISNIITNSVRYTPKNGYIYVYIYSDRLIIRNEYYNNIPREDLFERFVRSNDDKDATGLGLAIVKNICMKTGLQVTTEVTPNFFSLYLRLL